MFSYHVVHTLYTHTVRYGRDPNIITGTGTGTGAGTPVPVR
jgi:hypothetical protein